MKANKWIIKMVIVVFLSIGSLEHSFSQEKKVATTPLALYQEILHMDSVLFNAYNRQDIKIFKALLTEDLEWFQDNDGLIPYETVFKNFENSFNEEFKLNRELVKGSLKVYPIKNYGAIEIGEHQFKHIENGKEETGTFKFMMIWK